MTYGPLSRVEKFLFKEFLFFVDGPVDVDVNDCFCASVLIARRKAYAS